MKPVGAGPASPAAESSLLVPSLLVPSTRDWVGPLQSVPTPVRPITSCKSHSSSVKVELLVPPFSSCGNQRAELDMLRTSSEMIVGPGLPSWERQQRPTSVFLTLKLELSTVEMIQGKRRTRCCRSESCTRTWAGASRGPFH